MPGTQQPLSPLRPQPYYLTTTTTALCKGMLPQMARVYGATGTVTPKLWQVPRTSGGLVQSISGLLDRIGKLLCSEARTRRVIGVDPETGHNKLVNKVLSGRQALASPLTRQGPGQVQGVPGQGQEGPGGLCMLLDTTKVAATRHVRTEEDRGKYLRLDLALVQVNEHVRRPNAHVFEYAHRIVLWAMHGPPPEFLKDHPVDGGHAHLPQCTLPQPKPHGVGQAVRECRGQC